MIDDLANRATCEVVNLNLTDKPPCERYQAVFRIFATAIGLALAEQREAMLTLSEN